MRRIVVTGATGMIGVYLINVLLRENNQVYAIIRPKSHNVGRLPKNHNLEIIELPLEEIEKVSDFIKEADAFYHLAWDGTRAPYRDDAGLQQKNFLGSLKAMSAAISLKCRVFIGTGSQAEYGIANGEIDEEYFCKPVTAYGWEKLHTYYELSKIAEQTGIRFVWMRIFSAYGKYDFSKTMIMSCIEKMKENLPVELTECKQLWDYIYAGDIADGMIRFLETEGACGVYNIASGKARPLKEYVEELHDILKSHSDIKYGAIPYDTNGPINLVPIVNKLKRDLNWEPQTSFATGIRKMLEIKEVGEL